VELSSAKNRSGTKLYVKGLQINLGGEDGKEDCI
jgi:hypothetical protein